MWTWVDVKIGKIGKMGNYNNSEDRLRAVNGLAWMKGTPTSDELAGLKNTVAELKAYLSGESEYRKELEGVAEDLMANPNAKLAENLRSVQHSILRNMSKYEQN